MVSLKAIVHGLLLLSAVTVSEGPWLGAASAWAADPSDSAEPTLNDVLSAWSARSKRITSVRIQTEGRFTTPSVQGDEAAMAPCTRELRWTGDGEPAKFYYSSDRLTRSRLGVEQLNPGTRTVAFDGTEYRSLMHYTEVGYKGGRIRRGPASFSRHLGRLVELYPIVIHFRGIDPMVSGLPKQIQKIELTDKTAVLNGHRCLVLELRGDSEMWVCPEQDYAMKLYRIRGRGGEWRSRIHVDHKLDEEFGWVPSSWTIESLRPDGTLEDSFRESVTKYQLNQPLDPKEFQIEFPPETWVSDDTLEQKPVFWMTGADGTRKVMNPEEAKATYFKLTEALRKPVP